VVIRHMPGPTRRPRRSPDDLPPTATWPSAPTCTPARRPVSPASPDDAAAAARCRGPRHRLTGYRHVHVPVRHADLAGRWRGHPGLVRGHRRHGVLRPPRPRPRDCPPRAPGGGHPARV